MDLLVVAVLGVVVVALATALAPRVGIAGPLALVAIGIGVSLLPFFPAWEVNPEIILVGVLPPLLYSSAVSLPAIEFRRDFRPIAGLSILLVLVSTAVGREDWRRAHEFTSVYTIVSPFRVPVAARVPAGSSRASTASACHRVCPPGASAA